jgi:MYXO-CTERM domain-containing protein
MKGNRDGISHLVPVYTVEAYANSFQPDGAHLLPKTPISKALVAAMLDDPDPKGGHFTEDPAAVDPEPEKDTQQSSYSSDGKDATDQAVVAETEESGSSVLLFFVLAAVAAFLLARRRR